MCSLRQTSALCSALLTSTLSSFWPLHQSRTRFLHSISGGSSDTDGVSRATPSDVTSLMGVDGKRGMRGVKAAAATVPIAEMERKAAFEQQRPLVIAAILALVVAVVILFI